MNHPVAVDTNKRKVAKLRLLAFLGERVNRPSVVNLDESLTLFSVFLVKCHPTSFTGPDTCLLKLLLNMAALNATITCLCFKL